MQIECKKYAVKEPKGRPFYWHHAHHRHKSRRMIIDEWHQYNHSKKVVMNVGRGNMQKRRLVDGPPGRVLPTSMDDTESPALTYSLSKFGGDLGWRRFIRREKNLAFLMILWKFGQNWNAINISFNNFQKVFVTQRDIDN